MIIEPLLFCPSIREIPDFYSRFNTITKYDKYFVRYVRPEIDAYVAGRNAFLENEQYTHYVICPDDLLFTEEAVDRLVRDIEYFQSIDKKKEVIISGFCNVDTTEQKHLANITFHHVSARRVGRTYNFLKLDEVRKIRAELGNNEQEPFIRVFFAGFPLMAIPRVVIEQVPFKNDSATGYERHGCCLDVMFCCDANSAGYEIWVDLDLDLYHKKIADGYYENDMTGLKVPKKYFEYKKKEKIVL